MAREVQDPGIGADIGWSPYPTGYTLPTCNWAWPVPAPPSPYLLVWPWPPPGVNGYFDYSLGRMPDPVTGR